MKLDLDETWEEECLILDEWILPIRMNESQMKVDVFWSFGCMSFVALDEQKYDG